MVVLNRSGLGSPALIIALLAALGIGPSLIAQKSSSPPSREPSSNPLIVKPVATATAEIDDAPAHSAAALLENFLDTNPAETSTEKPWSRGDRPSTNSARPLTGSRVAYAIEFLIATLPEPGSPPLRGQFDADLDAISFALGRTGYALASFDLPWIDDAQENSKTAESDHNSGTSKADSRSSEQADVSKAHRSQGATERKMQGRRSHQRYRGPSHRTPGRRGRIRLSACWCPSRRCPSGAR